ncbi:MAG: bifunctional aspartate kinase/diaminopimelate decarboxylase, partial [bacterium]|nr:bifunctional aspartate kinase/diaminopimelate decarboxylase [bacterium]
NVILGRGGSDTSAAYFGVILGAQAVQIWTDVPGMFTANPHEIPSALLLPELDYEEAQELASAGANILHPRCIEPLKRQNIPLEIKWMERPLNPGTTIKNSSLDQNQQLKAVICKKSVFMVSIDTTRMWQKVGFLAEIFNCFKEQGLSVDLVTTSQNNVTVTLDNQLNPLNIKTLDELLTKLSFFCKASYTGPCASISLIGKGARPVIHELNPLKQLLQEKSVYMISQSASDINYSFVVDEDDAVRVSRILHAEFFSNVNPKRNLGPSWNALLSNKAREENSTIPWWQNSANILIAKAKNQSPVYVYNKATIVNNLTELKKITAISKIFYAIKANSHQQILTTVANHDFGFECVSIEEILWVKKLFPDIKADKILFTPSFANIEEYRTAFNLKCFVTVDNLWLLQKYPEVFTEQKFLIRIDPQTPQGHHKHVKTAGTESKFGISTDDLAELFIQAKKINASVIGFHAHVGSGVLTAETWKNTALLLAQLAEQYPSVSILNLGGGLGIVEKPEQYNLDLLALNQGLEEIKIAYPQYDFWLEPGRYVVATAGVLLAQVTQIKNKKYKHFIGINAGMNSFLRPALYGSFHPIVNLTKLQHKHCFTADVVGPICESGDVMGYNRSFPETDPGDVVLIANTGAYGRVMSSHYNLKMPAEEIWLA